MLIDWFTVAAQVVNFLILVWLLKRFLYHPVLAAIDEREKRIAAQLQDADKKKAQALQEKADFQRKNEDFEQQRVRRLAEVASAAQAEKEKLMTAARQDATELRARLWKSAQDEMENVNRKMGTLAQQEVFSIAEKVLHDLAGSSLSERTTDVFLARLHEWAGKHEGDLQVTLRPSSKPVLVRSAFTLGEAQKAAIEGTIKALLGTQETLKFEINPDLISGIELVANGQKISWSISEYLSSLTQAVTALLSPKIDPVVSPPKVVPHAA